MKEMKAPKRPDSANESRLYLTDSQLNRGVEAMFFAYRGFTSAPDKILAERELGRAHHRVLHFVGRKPGLMIGELLRILGVTKQSLNRVLRKLMEDELVRQQIGEQDKRARHLYLTESGKKLQDSLVDAQHQQMREAYRKAGAGAVEGYRKVLEAMMDQELFELYQELNGDFQSFAGKQSWVS